MAQLKKVKTKMIELITRMFSNEDDFFINLKKDNKFKL